MGVMILANGIEPVVEYANNKFEQLQDRIVLDNYSIELYNLYKRFDSLTDEELKEWKKSTNPQVNKLLFIGDRTEFTPTQLKKMIQPIKELYIAYEDIDDIRWYIFNVMNHCVNNKCNLIFIKRPGF